MFFAHSEDMSVPIREFAERIAAKNYIEIKGTPTVRGSDKQLVEGTAEDHLGQTITLAHEGMLVSFQSISM